MDDPDKYKPVRSRWSILTHDGQRYYIHEYRSEDPTPIRMWGPMDLEKATALETLIRGHILDLITTMKLKPT